VEKAQERGLVDPVFSTRSFLRTLSYREFVTALSLALLALALFRLLDYYSNEAAWIGNNGASLKWAMLAITVPVNHIFYKAEHKRANNFIGRNLHDYVFLLLFVTLYKLELFIFGSGVTFSVDGVGSFILVLLLFVVCVMLFEILVAVVKRFFRLFKWQVL
jgi:hypothetical protein